MSAIRIIRSDDFTGGLNLRATPFQLSPSESPDLLNVDIDPRGGFTMRGGTAQLNSSAIGALSAGTFTPKRMFVWEASTPQVLVAANSKVFYTSSSSFTDTTIATTAAHGASFASWSGATQKLYVAGGRGGVVNKWDGTTKTALTASGTAAWQDSYASPTGTHAPKADHIASHVGHMWVANTVEDGVTYPDRIRFSHANFPESWASLDYIDIVDGGSGITALVSYGEALYVFKRSSIHVIYGIDSTTFQVQRVTDTLGAFSPQCVVANERGLMFFSWPDGVFRLDGANITDLFQSIRPLIQLQQVNEAALANLHLGYVNRRLWVSIPQGTDTVASYTYVYDQSLGSRGAWTRYRLASGVGVACVADFETSTGARFPLACHPTEPYVLKVDQPNTTTDGVSGATASFTSYYVTRWQDAGNVSERKMWRRPDFVVQQPTASQVLTCVAYHNWEESLAKRTFNITIPASGSGVVWSATASEPDAVLGWGEADWGATNTGSTLARGSNIGNARSIQLKISGPGGTSWGVSSITYKYVPRKVR